MAAVIPHHHHEDIACIVIENCDQDNTINDKQDLGNRSKDCQIKINYITPKHNQTKAKSLANKNCGKFSLITLYLLFQNFTFKNDFTVIEPGYGKYIFFLTSSDVASLYKGLRAPPYSIC